MNKSVIVTLRFDPQEMRELRGYLQRNGVFDSLSSLGRVATMEFIRTRQSLRLQPTAAGRVAASGSGESKRPWFLWDYDLTEAHVHELLRHAPFAQRKWLLGRMLERLGPEEIVQYVSLKELRKALPHLRLPAAVKRHWEEALAIWHQPAPTS